jgi:pimeloyl-ACP methyl ester carboxylesterase
MERGTECSSSEMDHWVIIWNENSGAMIRRAGVTVDYVIQEVKRRTSRKSEFKPQGKCLRIPTTYSDSRGINAVLYGYREKKLLIVLIPDPPNVISHMEPLALTICEAFPEAKVLVFEPIGFGQSFFNAKFSFGLQQTAKMIIEVLQSQEFEKSVVCVPCVMNIAGFLAANERPDLITHYLAIQAPDVQETINWLKRMDPKEVLRKPILGQSMLQINQKKIAQEWYEAAVCKTCSQQDCTIIPNKFAEPAIESLQHGSIYCLASAFQALFEMDIDTQTLEVRQPSLLLWGKKDRSHKPTDPRSCLKYLKNCTGIRFSECSGHFPELEDPQAFVSCVKDLSSNPQRPSKL